ncbi:MAG: amidase [Rhodobacteraceae bacterium]|jgi:amidase/aspartyl-tRNA(Asn)/glutamyl-tRNA(Gln) amidotransferase subunit A|nr:amidase [Paracoccaceae bacterium]
MFPALQDLCLASGAELIGAYAGGVASPVDVTRACLDRAEKINPALNAFAIIDHAGAMAAAAMSEGRWKTGQALSPIDGLPVTIKDIVHCHGLDVRYGSKTTADVSALPDSPVVERLRAAGAVILGLTTTPEFGWKAVTDSIRHGVTRNPWNPGMTPGGSSGGAAVAAAMGAGVLHLGTDGGGSIRIPASFCGIAGLKPSFGRVPAYPASAFGTVAHIGPMARSVGDLALMLNAMSGRDLRDWTQGAFAMPPVNPRAMNWAGVRIGHWARPPVGTVDAEVAALISAVLSDLALAGAIIEPVDLPDQDDLPEMFRRHWFVGAANRLDAVAKADRPLLDPGFVATAEHGARYSAVDRMQAEVARARYGAQMDQLLAQFDFILSPTVAIPPFAAGHDVPPGSGLESWTDWAGFSYPINLSQQPACSVPCGFTQSGLPVGLQIIGPRGADEAVLSAALIYEQMFPERFLTRASQLPDGVL